MRVQTATFPSFGIDTVLELDTAACRFLAMHGYNFVVRYLGGLTPAELAKIMCSGLAMMPVTRSHKPGWVPSAELGDADGVASLCHLNGLGLAGLPSTVWLDFEQCAGPASAAIDWANAWSLRLTRAGYEAGLYVGSGAGLSSEQLWKLPHFTRYWRSCSIVPEPANRGFCMFQLKPPNIQLAPGLIVDVDVICEDWRGGKPKWVVGD
jgi:hypothetical protein